MRQQQQHTTATVYAVSAEAEAGKAAPRPAPEDHLNTWSAAADRARQLLAAERDAGTSLAWSYLGGWFPGIRFRAKRCARAYQLLTAFANVPLSYFACQGMGFDVLSCAAFALARHRRTRRAGGGFLLF